MVIMVVVVVVLVVVVLVGSQIQQCDGIPSSRLSRESEGVDD